MKSISRYKRLINDIGAVFSLFLSYKNTDHTHYKQLVKNWGVGEVCSLLSEVEAFSVEELKHELYSLDGKPLKRFIDDLGCYLPNHNKELYCLAHDKEIFSLLEDIHGGKNAHLIIDNLTTIAITAQTKIGRVALILNELQPQEQPQGKQDTAADGQKNSPKRSRGRPKDTLKDKMKNDPTGERLKKIHALADGKKGKDFALIILACMLKGWIDKPTYTQVTKEFGNIGDKSGYNKYMHEIYHSKEEIEGAKNSLN